MRYLYVATTVLLTVYGQLVVKWQVGNADDLPGGVGAKVDWVLKLVINPWIISVFAAAAVAAGAWFLAISHWELSRAYPFVATSFVLVLIGSAVFFSEPITVPKVAGILLIFIGLAVGTQ
jgi:multidrug transporter EmrE-like cation transporter